MTSSRNTLLIRSPSPLLSNGVVTHIQDSRNSVSFDLAKSQWEIYKSIFSKRDWNLEIVENQDDCPDGVFVEDSVVYFSNPLLKEEGEAEAEEEQKKGKTKGKGKGLILLCKAGHPSRTKERSTIEDAIKSLKNGNQFNSFDIEEIKDLGTLDGGDILKYEKQSIVYVGRGGRTNSEGIKQLRILLGKRGYTVIAVPMTKALHLKSAVTALPCGTIIGDPNLLDNISIFPRFLPIPHPHGVAVVVLSSTEVLMSSSSKESYELVESLGYDVIKVDISEFEKLEGW